MDRTLRATGDQYLEGILTSKTGSAAVGGLKQW